MDQELAMKIQEKFREKGTEPTLWMILCMTKIMSNSVDKELFGIQDGERLFLAWIQDGTVKRTMVI